MNIVVGVSDARTSADPADVIATYSLGSCIGVAVYDPVRKVAGMLHYQLPTATADPARGEEKPLMFADTGMAWLLKEMEKHGADRKRLKVKIAGAAEMLADATLFQIGKRNHASIRKILWQQGIFIDGEDVGGKTPRNLYLSVADGSVVVKAQGQSKTL